jgi:MoxR-like ATPase
VLAGTSLNELRSALADVVVREELVDYAVDLVRASRSHEGVMTGAGPRASQALVMAARAQAVISGRDYVSPDDLRELAEPVIAHRLILRPEYEIEGTLAGHVVADLLNTVAVPR